MVLAAGQVHLVAIARDRDVVNAGAAIERIATKESNVIVARAVVRIHEGRAGPGDQCVVAAAIGKHRVMTCAADHRNGGPNSGVQGVIATSGDHGRMSARLL
jgi:hypothetical protein